jgi:hypothetical protein
MLERYVGAVDHVNAPSADHPEPLIFDDDRSVLVDRERGFLVGGSDPPRTASPLVTEQL